MPHTPKPFYKANRNAWYVERYRVQHVLGKYPANLPPPIKKNGVWQARRRCMDAFYKKMATKDERAPVREVFGQQVLSVFDQFLGWCKKHKAPLTYIWYRNSIQSFVGTIDRHLPIQELKPIQVEHWVDAHPDSSPFASAATQGRRAACPGLGREDGVIDRNPIRYLEKPQIGKREEVISPDEVRHASRALSR